MDAAVVPVIGSSPHGHLYPRLAELWEARDAGGLYLQSLFGAVGFKGKGVAALFRAVAPQLDGRSSVDAVLSTWPSGPKRDAVQRLLDALIDSELVRLARTPRSASDDDHEPYLRAAALNGEDALGGVATASVAVLAGPAELVSGLRAHGLSATPVTLEQFREGPARWTQAVFVGALPAVLDDLALEVNELSVAAGTAALFASCGAAPSPYVHLGPVVIPGESACLQCARTIYERASLATKPADVHVRQPSEPNPIPRWAAELMTHSLVLESLRLAARLRSALVGAVCSYETPMRRSEVPRVARCSTCGAQRRFPPPRLWA